MMENYIAPIFLAGTVLIGLFIFFLVSFLVTQKQKQNKLLLEKQRAAYQYQTELLRTKLEMHELAMNQISREIHDNVGQILGLAIIHLITLSSSATPTQQQAIESISSLVSNAISDLRNISHSLNSDYIKRIGLHEAIQKEIDSLSRIQKMEATVTIEGHSSFLNAEQELFIFRIVQEALNNIIKHAQANVISVNMHYHEHQFRLQLSDNGVGFDIDTAYNEGVGLLNMRQRAELLKGTLEIQSDKNYGSTIRLIIDHPHENNY